MFRPMAITMALALFGSVVFSLFTFPAGAALLLESRRPRGAAGSAKLDAPYRAAGAAGRWPSATCWSAAPCALLLAHLPGRRARWAPTSCRASTRATSWSPSAASPASASAEARKLDLAAQKVLARFPEVETTLGMTGRAEVAVDPGRHRQHRSAGQARAQGGVDDRARPRRPRRGHEDGDRERGAVHVRLHLAAHRGPHQRADLRLARRRGRAAVRRRPRRA